VGLITGGEEKNSEHVLALERRKTQAFLVDLFLSIRQLFCFLAAHNRSVKSITAYNYCFPYITSCG
jgi:hypothetical protein